MHNVDLSSIVSGHTDYAKKIDEILISLGYADDDEEAGGPLRKCVSSHKLKEHRDPSLFRSQSMDSFLVVSKKGGPSNILLLREK
jgi:hypothetical protein